MGEICIRPTSPADLESVAALYMPQRDTKTLRWVLADPYRKESLRSFVAVDGTHIVGHTGYTISHFQYGQVRCTGLHGINWVVPSQYRGRGIGSQLFEQTFPLADFCYDYGGTESSHPLFLAMQFREQFSLQWFQKILNPRRYFHFLQEPFFRKAAKTLLLYGRSQWQSRQPVVGDASVGVRAYDPEEPIRPIADPDCIVNSPPREHIAWLLRCPLLKTYALHITQEDRPIGLAVCYVNTYPNDIQTGRIVHLSYLGQELSVWWTALERIEAFLSEKGCACVSTLACHSTFMAALTARGHRAVRRTPFWVRDPEQTLPQLSWHLTALEGDIGYRKV